MNKRNCALCGIVLLASVSLGEGVPLLCHNYEKKKQPHIEQGAKIQRNASATMVISDTGSSAIAAGFVEVPEEG